MNRQMTAQEGIDFIQKTQIDMGNMIGNVLNRLEKIEGDVGKLKEDTKLINIKEGGLD